MQRSCLIALRLADALGLPAEERASLYYARLDSQVALAGHAVGFVAREAAKISAIRAADDAARVLEQHAGAAGADRTMLEFPDAAADAVRYLDEHWDGRGQPYKLRGDAIPILARIACLAQTADVFIAQDGLAAARAMVRARRGRGFDPAVADAFLALPTGTRSSPTSRVSGSPPPLPTAGSSRPTTAASTASPRRSPR